MEPVEASVTGTLRIIAVLILLWTILRFIRRRSAPPGPPKGTNWAAPEQRPKGDVRIERIKEPDKSTGPDRGGITDADYEEVK